MDTKYKVEGEREVRGVPEEGVATPRDIEFAASGAQLLSAAARSSNNQARYNIPFFCNRVAIAII